MAITSIMRDNIGTKLPLGKVTIHENEHAYEVIRKGIMFIRRNLSKREKGIGDKDIQGVLGYLFDKDPSSIELHKVSEIKDLDFLEGDELYDDTPVTHEEWDSQAREFNKTEISKTKKEVWDKIKIASNYQNIERGGHEDFVIARIITDHHHRNKQQSLVVVIGQPNQFKSNRNGVIYSYQKADGYSFQINLDRLMSVGILVNMYKEVGIIGNDEGVDKFIKEMFHYNLPQSKTSRKNNHCYRVALGDMADAEYFVTKAFAEREIVEGFKRSYRMELNIKSMEEYERTLNNTVATAFETKKNIPANIQQVMANNEFLGRFKFVELDEDTDLSKFKIVENYYNDIKPRLAKVPVRSLRFRKLGKHRATGLYSPSHRSIAVDLRQFDSFIHEYGHAIDYMYEEGDIQSMKYGFVPILELYEKGLPKSIGKRGYYLTPTEVFARAYEVVFKEKNPSLVTGLMKEREAMMKNPVYAPFYQDKDLYQLIMDVMEEYI